MNLVFIARSWQGRGGMQRLNRDLTAECTKAFGDRFTCIHPQAMGIVGFVCRALIASVRVGVIKGQVHLSDMSLLPFGVLAHILGARVTATACGLDVTYAPPWYQMMIRRCVRSVDTVACISNTTRDAVLKRGVSADRIVVIPCGVHPADVRSPVKNEQPLLVTVGRLIERKGVAWFISTVMPQLPHVRYVVIGSGPQEGVIRDAIARYSLQGRVQLVTNADDAVRDAYLRQADIFVMPNIPVEGDMEGFGIVCMEASVRGVPVAGSRLEGVQDAVIDGVTGRLFEACDGASWVSGIEAMLRHPLLGSDSARATVNRFGWDAVFQQYRTHVFH